MEKMVLDLYVWDTRLAGMLRKTLLSVVLCLLEGFASQMCAQSTHMIEPATIEVRYEVLYDVDKETFVLRCGKAAGQYFSINNLRHDSLLSSLDPSLRRIPLEEALEEVRHRDDPSKRIPRAPGHGDYLYWNLSAGKVSVYTSVFGDRYVVEEDIPVMDWELEEDSVRTIAGYECHKARTRFRGRDWSVWYTEDIPVSLGPWKLNGLPGIILRAECDGYVTITANELSATGLTPVMFYNFSNYKYEPVERKKYLKMKNNPNSYPPNTKITPMMELE